MECDFPESEYKRMEAILLEHSPAQVIDLVWRKDPNGDHELEWFEPFFKGYVKKVIRLQGEVQLTDQFWEAYDLASKHFDAMSTFDMPAIYAMCGDIPRMRKAIECSKVKNIRYVAKVYEDVPATGVRHSNPVGLDFEIGNSGIQTRRI